MYRSMLIALGVAAAAACGRGDRQQAATADSLNRDLQLAPTDTAAPQLSDRPADTARTTEVATPAPAKASPSKPKPAPARSTPSNAAKSETPAAAPASLAAGTAIDATLKDSISSRTNKVGDVIEAATTSDVKDASGRTVIPKGSIVTLTITAIHESENKSDKTGTLTLQPSEVKINGKSYKLAANIDAVATELRGRSTNAGDIAKVGAGTAVGAVVGRVLGGSTKGAVIGGVIGGAVGAQRAVETKDRDVVVPAGASIKLTLKEPLTPTA
ncbi:MAG TPA: hypothetical protein VFS11_06735 [Gemmatimonadales bacterium]|nr:hypothetical protein [Gemmatimonadales bacterium]